jgi:hypothetical protein
MNRFEQQFKKEAEHIRLSAAEKQAMRARLQEAMAPAAAAPSPFVPSFVEGYFSRFEFFGTARYAFAALLMIVFVGGGTVSAASAALPGDWLYAVKTEFNEQVELAWADTPDEEALTEARFAQRRVAEAEALEAEGRFNEELALEIEQRFDTHASRARALARGGVEVAADSAASRSITFTIGAPSANEEGTEGEPPALMATMAADEPDATTTLEMDAKLQAGAEVEAIVDEVIGDVEDTLAEHRERLERLRERLNARREALEANATTTINYNNVRVQVEANGDAEITVSGVDDAGAVVETVKDVTDSVEEAVDEVLPIHIKIGL